MTATGVVASFHKSRDGDVDGLQLDDGTEVRFPASASEKLTTVVTLKDRVTIEGWANRGESEIHAATIKNEASGKVVIVDRPPPTTRQDAEGPRRQGGREDEADDRRPPRHTEEGGPDPRPRPEAREDRPPRRDQGRQYSLEQATSDEAQLRTIAFDGLVLQHHFAIGGFRGLRHTGGMVNRTGRFGVSWKSFGGLYHGYGRTA
ncbi:MAG: hypothetical protein NTW96_07195, partial [Planctomycetia bacterium]|nr:hypothetical protein [Planctomycetia bacterium]